MVIYQVRKKKYNWLMQDKHHANLLLSMNNYNPLVISRNDKNKQLTLLCQRKLALINSNK